MLVDMGELIQFPWAVIASTHPNTYLLTDDRYPITVTAAPEKSPNEPELNT